MLRQVKEKISQDKELRLYEIIHAEVNNFIRFEIITIAVLPFTVFRFHMMLKR